MASPTVGDFAPDFTLEGTNALVEGLAVCRAARGRCGFEQRRAAHVGVEREILGLDGLAAREHDRA